MKYFFLFMIYRLGLLILFRSKRTERSFHINVLKYSMINKLANNGSYV